MTDECENCGAEQDPTKARWESVGPFNEYRCVVDGWVVPLLEARELDGGKVSIVVNGWRGYVATVQEANLLIPFLADVIASAMGYRAHPQATDDKDADTEERKRIVQIVPHESLAPYRIVGITGIETAPSDSPKEES